MRFFIAFKVNMCYVLPFLAKKIADLSQILSGETPFQLLLMFENNSNGERITSAIQY